MAVLANLVQTIEEFVLNSLCLMESINAKYVSQKISKIRWRPVSHAALQQPEIFVTGSWDNEVEDVFHASPGVHSSPKTPRNTPEFTVMMREHKNTNWWLQCYLLRLCSRCLYNDETMIQDK